MTLDTQSLTVFANLTDTLVAQATALSTQNGLSEIAPKYRHVLTLSSLEQRIADNDNFICPVEELALFVDFVRSDRFRSRTGIIRDEKTLLTGSRTQGQYISEKRYRAAIDTVLGQNNVNYDIAVGLYSFFNEEAKRMNLMSNELFKIAEIYNDPILDRIFHEPIKADFDVVNDDVKNSILNYKNQIFVIRSSQTKIDFHPSPHF